jgi:phosphatidylglycerol---prolipoprotein diacylglyceryl transferase
MRPEIQILGVSVKTFGLTVAIAYVLCTLVVARRLIELGRPPVWASGVLLIGALGGFVGAHLYWLVQHRAELGDKSFTDLLAGGGLVWYGGLAGGGVAVLLWARWRGILGPGVLDLFAPALAVGYAIIRIGCQLSGDGDYGKPSSLPWAMGYPEGTAPTPAGVTVHPAPIYETLGMGLVALLLWQKRDKLPLGSLFALYLLLAGLERFLVEFVRRGTAQVAGLTSAQLVSLALMAAGAAWLAVSRGRPQPAPMARLAA